MGKRAATPAGPAWKKQRGTGLKAKINTVVAALTDTGLECDTPDESRVMIAEGASHSLNSFVEDRHPMQETIIGFIKESLTSMADRLSGASQKAKDAVATAESELEVQKAQVQVTLDELEEAKAAIDAKFAACKEATEFAATCQQALEEFNIEKGSNTREHDQITKSDQKIRSLQDEDLKALLEEGGAAGGSDKAAKKICDKLTRELSKLGAEPALLAAAPPVLLKLPQDRAGFDSHVLESLKGVLTAELDNIAKRLAENLEAAKNLEPAEKERTEAGEKATAAKEQASADLAAAEETAEKKQDAVVAAKSQVESTELELETKKEAVTAAEKDCEAFAEVTACLDFLATRSSAPVEEEPKETEAAAEPPAQETAEVAAA